ncbi:MAG: hypothetical protein DRO39_09430 [Thermoprotei archaeon]|nr:MAG: hypothetical protein DRO39_09430 [Thermoprotei archaeon]
MRWLVVVRRKDPWYRIWYPVYYRCSRCGFHTSNFREMAEHLGREGLDECVKIVFRILSKEESRVKVVRLDEFF